MDPLHIAIRAASAYLILLGLMRVSGKRAVGEASPFDFTLTLVLGDMVDDMILSEVDAGMFIVGAGVLLLTHVLSDRLRLRSASRG